LGEKKKKKNNKRRLGGNLFVMSFSLLGREVKVEVCKDAK